MNVLLAKALVWSRWLFCVIMDRERVEVNKLAKKGTRLIPIHFDQGNLVNKKFRGYFTWWTQRVVLIGQYSAISAAWVANHSEGFG